MRPDAMHSYLVVLESIIDTKGFVLLVCISMYYPSQLLSFTLVSSRRLSSFRHFTMETTTSAAILVGSK